MDDPVLSVSQLAEQIVAAGIPIFRMTTGVPVLHPNVRSISVLWEAGGETTVRQYTGQIGYESVFLNSPLYVVYTTGVTERVEIPPEPVEGEYGIVEDMRAIGATDYVAIPMRFSDRSNKALTFATQRPGGFETRHIEALESITTQIAPVLEIHTQRRMAETILDTYVGPTAGRRVLNGEIQRGDGEAIQAIIWFSDLMGFTELSNSIPGPRLVDLLNRYFGAVAGAVETGGGEVLKFIGDAVLAIFPYSDGSQGRSVAGAALAATRQALAELKTAFADDEPALRCGVALHAGEVFYGNVGGENRLDFTVIGPAVNLASRIEGKTRELGFDVLVSADFAELNGGGGRSLGRHVLKGIDGEVEIFVPDGLET